MSFYDDYNRGLYKIGTAKGIELVDISPEDIASGTFTSILGQALGNISGGKTKFDNTEVGYILGIDEGTAKFYLGSPSAYINWDGTTLTVVGGVSIDSLDIGGADATSMHVDSAGNMWLGAATFATAPFTVSNAGAVTGSSVTITGGSVATSTLNGLVGLSNLNIAAQGWTQTSVFSVTDLDTVAWGTGTLTTAAGTAYTISAGNTGNMAAKTYIYLDIAVSVTVYQTTTTAATAVGSGKILVAIAQNAVGEATYQVMSGQGGQNIDAANIVAGTITSNEIAAGYVYAGAIAVSQLTAGTITSKSIVLAVADGTGDVEMRAGIATGDFDNTGAATGFIMGIDDSDSNKAKSYIGDATHYFKFNGTTAEATGVNYIENYTAGENITAGNVVCMKLTAVTLADQALKDNFINSASPNTNYNGNTLLLDEDVAYNILIQLNLAALPSADSILQCNLLLTPNGPGSQTIEMMLITADWTESTVTWNTAPTGNTSNIYIIKPTITGAGQQSIDITPLIRLLKEDNFSTYWGIRIHGGSDTGLNFASRSDATTTSRPALQVISINTSVSATPTSDGKVYKADDGTYNLCRNIIGIATTTKNATETVPVQFQGTVAGTSIDAGQIIYLASTGGYTNSAANLLNAIQIGLGTSTNLLRIDKNQGNILIENYKMFIPSGATKYYYVPSDAKEAWIYAQDTNTKFPVYLRRGTTANNFNTVTWLETDTSGGTNSNISITFNWRTNTSRIAITATTVAAANVTFDVYLYK